MTLIQGVIPTGIDCIQHSSLICLCFDGPSSLSERKLPAVGKGMQKEYAKNGSQKAGRIKLTTFTLNEKRSF